MTVNVNFVISILIIIYFILNAYAFCPSLNSTMSTTVVCKFGNKTLASCKNPVNGTTALFSCNPFYEEDSLKSYSNHICIDDKWNFPIPECNLVCGRTYTGSRNTLASDKNILLSDYPWHVGIYSKEEQLLCGGSIINMNLILTAARCVTDLNGNIQPPSNFLVAAGKYYLTFNDSRDYFSQSSKVEQIEVPGTYKGENTLYINDIAVLTLTTPFNPTVTVQPICIQLNEQMQYVLSTDGILAGWGYNYRNQIVYEDLKSVPVLNVPFTECTEALSRYSIYLTKDKICGRYRSKERTDAEVSGGGLVFRNTFNDRYYIVGVLFALPNSNYIYESSNYSLFTSVIQNREILQFKVVAHNPKNGKNCKLPELQTDGQYNLLDVNISYVPESEVLSDSVLSLTCNSGYAVPSGATLFNCQNNGEWFPTITHCERELSNLNSTNNIYIIVAVSVTGILILSLIAALLVKLRREKQFRQQLKLAGIYNFEAGDLDSFDPDLGIDYQAELLPYNYNFEFPREKLKFGNQLGAGAFGIVMKAEAIGISKHEAKTTVAVKMVKKTADYMYLRALISELKILLHLGQHLNVVNLLGACTDRKLLVIVEYCEFGNLQNYLQQKKYSFVNQIDNATGNIDYTIESKEKLDVQVDKSGSLERNRKSKQLYTKELISWAFQIARGMEYLGSKKVVHGDLAARNVLLTDNNIVKICDFGLARRIYQSDNYRKTKDNNPLPIKWMAIELIRDNIFSTQSDVWSFGILLWELFSLAQTPYPDMNADEQLYFKLVDGYRMKSPQFATNNLYKIMYDCWNSDPSLRPSFNKLAGEIGMMLEENVRQHYISLNDPYLVMNMQRQRIEKKNNYLSLSRPSSLLPSAHFQSETSLLPSTAASSSTAPQYLEIKPYNN